MSVRSEMLATRIEQGADELARFAGTLSPAEWQTPILPDGRTAGVIVHHVASVYPVEIHLAMELASGRPIEGVTWTAVAEMNATHAKAYADAGQAETLALLRENSRAAAAAVRRLTDAQLDAAAAVSLNAGAPLTTQFLIEDHALRHAWHHLAKIKAALAAASVGANASRPDQARAAGTGTSPRTTVMAGRMV